MTSNEIATLVTHLTDKKWREVFREKINSMDNADQLILAMNEALINLGIRDEKIQDLLIWINQKSKSIDTQCKLVTIRALYLAIVRVIYLDFEKAFNNPQGGSTKALNFIKCLYKSDKLLENIPFDREHPTF